MEKEKKEIWMEKLIRYLLESKWEEYKDEYYEWYRDIELEQNIDSLSELKPFIKWLVENDKIDKGKIPQIDGSYYSLYDDYDNLLMSLSIQDEPIRFLCEIIK